LEQERPTAFVRVSTHPGTKGQWEETYSQLIATGFDVVPIIGLNGESTPGPQRTAWRRAVVSWAFCGFPFIRKCLNLISQEEDKEWFSCKHFRGVMLQDFQKKLKVVSNIEFSQTGYRQLTGSQPQRILDLKSMDYIGDKKENKNKNIAAKIVAIRQPGF
jgi:hypothetical protein